VTAAAENADVKPGSTAILRLEVRLPKDVHVQANRPRDASLIPTALTIDAPPGVAIEKITYPPPSELAQTGRKEKLLVLGPEFEIQVHVAVSDSHASGDVVIPARLRYQACNDTMCFPPARAEAQWTLRVTKAP
jgi:DsbC/DsbD-like thiol-disulfide interchange protein